MELASFSSDMVVDAQAGSVANGMNTDLDENEGHSFSTMSQEKWREGRIFTQDKLQNTSLPTADSVSTLKHHGKYAARTSEAKLKKTAESSSKYPRWTVVRQRTVNVTTSSAALDDTPVLRPRQWCSSKVELLAILPELSGKKCVNGISWKYSPVPVILVEEDNGIIMSKPQEPGSETVIDISMVREFFCAAQDLTRPCTVSEEEHVSLSIDVGGPPPVTTPSSAYTKASGSVASTPASSVAPVEKLPKKRPRGRPKRIKSESQTVETHSFGLPPTPRKKQKCQQLQATRSHNTPYLDAVAVSRVSSVSTSGSVSPPPNGVADEPTLNIESSPAQETVSATDVTHPDSVNPGRLDLNRSPCDGSATNSGIHFDPWDNVLSEAQTPGSSASAVEVRAEKGTPGGSSQKAKAGSTTARKKKLPLSEDLSIKRKFLSRETHNHTRNSSTTLTCTLKYDAQGQGNTCQSVSTAPSGAVSENHAKREDTRKKTRSPSRNNSVGRKGASRSSKLSTSLSCAPSAYRSDHNFRRPLTSSISEVGGTHLNISSSSPTQALDIIPAERSEPISVQTPRPQTNKPFSLSQLKFKKIVKAPEIVETEEISISCASDSLETRYQPMQRQEGSDLKKECCVVQSKRVTASFLTPTSLMKISSDTAQTEALNGSEPAATIHSSDSHFTSESWRSPVKLGTAEELPVSLCSTPFETPPEWQVEAWREGSEPGEICAFRPPVSVSATRWDRNQGHIFQDFVESGQAERITSSSNMLFEGSRYPQRTGARNETGSYRPCMMSLSSSPISDETLFSSSSSMSSMCTTSTPPTSPPSGPLREAPFVLCPVNDWDVMQPMKRTLRVGSVHSHESKLLVHKSLDLLFDAARAGVMNNNESECGLKVEHDAHSSKLIENGLGSTIALPLKRKPREYTDIGEQTPPLKKQNLMTIRGPVDDRRSFDNYLPTQNPAEIQVLTESYVHGTPVLCIASRASICGFLRAEVSEECKYMYLGFFQVTRVKETRILDPRVSRKTQTASGIIAGKVNWQFRLQWNAGGEEELQLPFYLRLERPWWCDLSNWDMTETTRPEQKDKLSQNLSSSEPASFSLSTSSLPSASEAQRDDGVVDSDTESTPFYRDCRRADVDYPSRHDLQGPRLPSLVWLPLLVTTCDEDSNGNGDRMGRSSSRKRQVKAIGKGDSGSWKGWYCTACGKLNRQTFYRRRKCSSSFCKDVLITACAVQELDILRDVGQDLPMVLPLNIVSSYIDPLVVDWDNGMRTLVYRPRQNNLIRPVDKVEGNVQPGVSASAVQSESVYSLGPPRIQLGALHSGQEIEDLQSGRSVAVKHIFTCNSPALQGEQRELLKRIQEDTLLAREETDLRPYFSYTVGVLSKEGSSSSASCFASAFVSTSFPPIPWSDAPSSIKQARELLEYLSNNYGELEEGQDAFRINQLVVLAWTVLGRRKGDTVLFARDCSIIIMCLGHEVTIELTPKSGYPPVSVTSKPSVFELKEPKAATIDAEDATGEAVTEPLFEDPMAVDSEVPRPQGECPTSTSLVPEVVQVGNSGIETSFPHSLSNTAPPANTVIAAESTATARKVAILEDDANMPTLITPPLPGSNHQSGSLISNTYINTDALLPTPAGLIKLEPSDEVEIKEEKETGQMKVPWIDHATEDFDTGVARMVEGKRRASTTTKTDPEKMCFTLVHGDALLLSGDDFEYTIQRTGVSLLLVGSNILRTA